MLGLTIHSVEVTANTRSGVFSVNIPLNKGLNIIRAENSSGKSTVVNAIAYGLGLESILGPSRKRPFPKSLYDDIFKCKSDDTPIPVISSYVKLKLSNNLGKTVFIKRCIKGDANKVSILSSTGHEDFFLGSSGQIGSSVSSKGYHNWLENFLNWPLPQVVNYREGITKLYLECIFPLFFIEQKRGWSEIQANIPTHYGIKNVKKLSVEFCLGIDSFERQKNIAILKNKVDHFEHEWSNLISQINNIAALSNLKVSPIPDLKKLDVELGSLHLYLSVNFLSLQNDNYITIKDYKKSLSRYLNELSSSVDIDKISDNNLTSQLTLVGKLKRQIDNITTSIDSLVFTISDIENKLLSINKDYDKYLQLRKLKKVGSTLDQNIEYENCPTCEREFCDSLGSPTVTREPMTLNENIEFLKNQIDFYTSIKINSCLKLEELKSDYRTLESTLNFEQSKLTSYRNDYNKLYSSSISIIRDTVETEQKLNNINKIIEREDYFSEKIIEIYKNWLTASESLKLAKSKKTTTNKNKIIRDLTSYVKSNLIDFKFNKSSIPFISISDRTLRPEQEGYDIVAETSASDYIRIIWAYTLALLEYSGQEQSARHGGFVVFDEPRQHETSKISFINLINKAKESQNYGGQVIFATSLDKNELEKACYGSNVNLQCFDDYILQK